MTYVEIDPRFARLGNWMFQYAAAKTAAKGGPVTFVIERAKDREEFAKYAALFPEPVVESAPAGADVRTEIYNDPRLVDADMARRLYPVPGERCDMVSIHVRRGDYMKCPEGFPFVGEDYLRRAVALFGEGRRFMVFSDDIPWCKRFFRGGQFAFSEGRSPLEDLYGIARCMDHISSNSTFSWWGAFLGPGGRTVFPSMWRGPFVPNQDWKSLYFPGSEVLHNEYSPALWRKAKWGMFRRKCRHALKKLEFWR